jgi:hypothetical protein
MQPLLAWMLAFVFVPVLTGVVCESYGNRSPWHWYALMHTGVLVSFVLTVIFLYLRGTSFTFSPNVLSIVLFAVACVLAVWLHRGLGALYAISALLQQLCMFAAALLLFPSYELFMVVILIALIYALSHLFYPFRRLQRFAVTFVWGVIAVWLYSSLHDPILTSAIHLTGGALLIRRQIIFPDMEGMI